MGQSYAALSGRGPELSSPLTALAKDAASFGDGTGCTPYAADALQDRIAVMERGFCEFEFKVAFAAEAGAKAVLVANTQGEDEPFVMFGLETTDNSGLHDRSRRRNGPPQTDWRRPMLKSRLIRR